MSRPGLVVFLATVLPGLAVAASAQGLGDVAARERQQRESQKGEKKSEEVRTFSNDDLEGLSAKTNEDSAGTVSTPSAVGVTPPSAGGASRPASGRSAAARLQPYESQVDRARSRVQALEAQLETLQQRLNPMSTTYIYGSTGGPVGGTQADEEQQVRSQITATEQQLQQARQALSAAEAALDQARRAPVQSATPATPARVGAPAGDAPPAQRP